jgi:crotonobetainyl-CoA:carnitine CoA-transferase CaiB-like acyl-CoA transferase
LSVTGDDEWRALCELASLPAELSSLDRAARSREHERIDDRLAEWTRTREVTALAAELQARRIIAAPVRDARDLVTDPHLAARGFWIEVDHAAVGRRVQPSLPIHWSATPATYRRGAPCLGEHNREVLRETLGCSEVEFDELEARGVLHRRPPAGSTFRGVQAPPAVAVPAASIEPVGGP